MILQVKGQEKGQNQFIQQQDSLKGGSNFWWSLNKDEIQLLFSSQRLIQYQINTVSKVSMYEDDSSPRTQERKQQPNPYLNLPKYKQILFAKKFYSCQCGYSKRFSFQSIQTHARKVHNILIDDSDDNYVVQYANCKQYYTYFLNPRPKRQRRLNKPRQNKQPRKYNKSKKIKEQIKPEEQGFSVNEEKECKQQHVQQAQYKPMEAYFSFRFLIHSYIKELTLVQGENEEINSDLNVMKDMNNYILSMKTFLANNPSLPNDLTFYFNDFITKALLKNAQESQVDLAKAARYVEALGKFWKRLRKNKKTKLDLVLNNKFFEVKEEHFD